MANDKGLTKMGPGPKELAGRRAPPWHDAAVSGAGMKTYALQKDQTPRGGPVPLPAIPSLDGEVVMGRTMAENAELQRARAQQQPELPQLQQGPSIIVPDQAARQPVQTQQLRGPSSPQPTDLLIQPTDILPPEALQDPAARAGYGAPLASHQPELARKYGVMRGGDRIPAQQLLPGAHNTLKPERTKADSLADLNRVLASPTGEKPPEPEAPKLTPEEEEEAKKERERKVAEYVEGLDDFEFDALRRRMTRDNLNNPDQRAIVEKRLKPLDLSTLIMHDYVTQDIPVHPGVFEFTFKSVSIDEDLELKRLLVVENEKPNVSNNYIVQKYAVMSMALGLLRINNNPVPGHSNSDGSFSSELFVEKMRWILRRPLHMIASLGTHHTWFEQRVRALFEAKELGNG